MTRWTPPGAWFADPQLDRPTLITTTDGGRVYGHVAAWSIDGHPACHIGHRGRCTAPPRPTAGFRYFNRRPVPTTTGTVHAGALTMGTGHAAEPLTAAAATAHYDDTGTMAAAVRAGEDAHGIWIAGALLPDLPAGQRTRLGLAAVSGDWRTVHGRLEMVGVLAVNVPGFPIPATYEEPGALVASGALVGPGRRRLDPAAAARAVEAAALAALDPGQSAGAVTPYAGAAR